MCKTKSVTLPRLESSVSVAGYISPVVERKFEDCGKRTALTSKRTTDPGAKKIKPVHDWTPEDGYKYEGGEEDWQKHQQEQEQQQQEK